MGDKHWDYPVDGPHHFLDVRKMVQLSGISGQFNK